MAPKQTFWNKYIQPNLTLSLVILVIGGGIKYYLDQEKKQIEQEAKDANVESRIYPTPLILQKAMDHDNEVPSDVENLRREIRLIEQNDITIERQVMIDSQQLEIKDNLIVIGKFYEFVKDNKTVDSLSAVKKAKEDIIKQASRDKRTQEIEDIGMYIREIKRAQDTLH